MAVYHRKLFPSSNKTLEDPCLNCPDCPSVCNLFDPYEPLPPEPSFVLPPPPLFIEKSSENNHVSALVIILVVVLATAFLIVSYYAIFVKYCSGWGSSSRRRSNRRGEETHEDFIDENHGLVVDHPIWFITTVGLEQSIINAISVCKYRKGEGLIEGTECSVCLNEFHEDETLRLLPKCSHAFHLPCIDTWLRSHKNCPLCRAPIVTNPNPVTVPVSGNSDVREETLGGSSESDGGLGGDSVVNDSGVRLEDEMELEDTRRDFNSITKEVVPCPPPNCGLRVLSDLADNHRAVENAIQPVRRSVSMDLSMFGSSVAHSLPVQAEGSSGAQAVGGKSSNLESVSKTPSVTPGLFRLMSSSSIGEFLQRGPVSMKRSFSSGGKFSRSSRSSVLPFCWRNRWCCSK